MASAMLEKDPTSPYFTVLHLAVFESNKLLAQSLAAKYRLSTQFWAAGILTTHQLCIMSLGTGRSAFKRHSGPLKPETTRGRTQKGL